MVDLQTPLPVGTYFRVKNRGKIDLGRIDKEEGWITWTLLRQIPEGVKVVDCKWVGDFKLLPRKTPIEE